MSTTAIALRSHNSHVISVLGTQRLPQRVHFRGISPNPPKKEVRCSGRCEDAKVSSEEPFAQTLLGKTSRSIRGRPRIAWSRCRWNPQLRPADRSHVGSNVPSLARCPFCRATVALLDFQSGHRGTVRHVLILPKALVWHHAQPAQLPGPSWS